MSQRKPFLFTLRKHKKKCIFFAAVGLWGTNYSIQQFRDYLERRKFCYEGKIFGDKKIPAIGKPRRLMLFLNPEANNGKALKSYERNAAPILHLGGLEITTVKTDYEGQCKALTQYLDPTIDGIIVAGGDGTLSEVLTGMLRRNDHERISKIPIGVIPIGRNNHSYNNIVDNTSDEEVRKIAKAAMNILKWETRNVSVMEIKVCKLVEHTLSDNQNSDFRQISYLISFYLPCTSYVSTGEGRPTYAMDHIEWGPLRDAKENERFWWTGPLKRRLPYILETLKKWPPVFSAYLSFMLPKKNVLSSINESLPSNSSQHNISSQNEKKEPSQKPSDKNSNAISLFGFFVKLFQNSTESSLHTSILPSNLTKLDFILCGWQLEAEGTLSNQNTKTTEMKEFELQPVNDEISWYTIDGEKFEARPIHVKILPDKIRVFCPGT